MTKEQAYTLADWIMTNSPDDGISAEPTKADDNNWVVVTEILPVEEDEGTNGYGLHTHAIIDASGKCGLCGACVHVRGGDVNFATGHQHCTRCGVELPDEVSA